MPPDHGPNHDRRPKPDGPKERELAVALTVAVLGASKIDSPLSVIEQVTLDVYERMLVAVTKTGSE